MTESGPDMSAGVLQWLVYIEIAGAVVGLGLTVLLIQLGRTIGGIVGASLNTLIIGVALFTIAFVAAAVLQGLGLTAMENTMLVHMVLMILALIMIVFSARRLATLTR